MGKDHRFIVKGIIRQFNGNQIRCIIRICDSEQEAEIYAADCAGNPLFNGYDEIQIVKEYDLANLRAH